jgi:hypothetical protein
MQTRQPQPTTAGMARQAEVIVAVFIGPDGPRDQHSQGFGSLAPADSACWLDNHQPQKHLTKRDFARRGRRAAAKAHCGTSADPARRRNRDASCAPTLTAGRTCLRRNACDRHSLHTAAILHRANHHRHSASPAAPRLERRRPRLRAAGCRSLRTDHHTQSEGACCGECSRNLCPITGRDRRPSGTPRRSNG